jgi:hypothetical protein
MKAGSIVPFSHLAIDKCSYCVLAAFDGIKIFQLNLRQMLLRLRLAANLAELYRFPASEQTLFILKNPFFLRRTLTAVLRVGIYPKQIQ